MNINSYFVIIAVPFNLRLDRKAGTVFFVNGCNGYRIPHVVRTVHLNMDRNRLSLGTVRRPLSGRLIARCGSTGMGFLECPLMSFFPIYETPPRILKHVTHIGHPTDIPSGQIGRNVVASSNIQLISVTRLTSHLDKSAENAVAR